MFDFVPFPFYLKFGGEPLVIFPHEFLESGQFLLKFNLGILNFLDFVDLHIEELIKIVYLILVVMFFFPNLVQNVTLFFLVSKLSLQFLNATLVAIVCLGACTGSNLLETLFILYKFGVLLLIQCFDFGHLLSEFLNKMVHFFEDRAFPFSFLGFDVRLEVGEAIQVVFGILIVVVRGLV